MPERRYPVVDAAEMQATVTVAEVVAAAGSTCPV
jgi:hypothetical protein